MEQRDEVEPHVSRWHGPVPVAHAVEQVPKIQEEEEPRQKQDPQEDQDGDKDHPASTPDPKMPGHHPRVVLLAPSQITATLASSYLLKAIGGSGKPRVRGASRKRLPERGRRLLPGRGDSLVTRVFQHLQVRCLDEVVLHEEIDGIPSSLMSASVWV